MFKLRLIYIIIFLISCVLNTFASDQELNDTLNSLDRLLENASQFTQKKEARIAELKREFSASMDPEEKYRLNIQLYEEYKAYQYDSAYHYANNSYDIAANINNPEYQLESKCALVFCLLSAGLFKEAFDVFQEIDISDVSKQYRLKYYALAIRLNYAIADYNNTLPFYEKSIDTGNQFTDSLLALISPNSSEWYYYTAQKQMKNRDYKGSISTFERLLSTDSIDTHLKAIIHSCLGWMYWQNGNAREGLINLAQSAKYDALASVKETTSLCGLAELLYGRGDIDRANDYIQHSLDDANFYGARHRKIEVNNILPIIENERYRLMKQQRNMMLIGGMIISVLVLALAFALFTMSKQKKKIEDAQRQIEDHNGRLTMINLQLKEVNKIKNEYIGNSFYQSARFIDKIENVYKIVSIKIEARKYSEVSAYLKDAMIKEERNNMFNVFDKTFLRIFPGFIEQYNSLFPEEEQKYPDKPDCLTTEMRIFALIRLGVTESERIAQFLYKSIHTINTYKTRVKNKSIVDNDKFEAKIMEIGAQP